MVDTHCHLNIMIRNFTLNSTIIPFNSKELTECAAILHDAELNSVHSIINVGTNLAESLLCIELAKHFANCFATIGIHPNDATVNWPDDIEEFKKILKDLDPRSVSGMTEQYKQPARCN